jgi:hypothetical protein
MLRSIHGRRELDHAHAPLLAERVADVCVFEDHVAAVVVQLAQVNLHDCGRALVVDFAFTFEACAADVELIAVIAVVVDRVVHLRVAAHYEVCMCKSRDADCHDGDGAPPPECPSCHLSSLPRVWGHTIMAL